MTAAVVDVRAVPSAFSPNRIVLRAGRTTILRFVNTDGVHGLYSKEFRIDHVVVGEGKTTLISVTPKAPGTYVLHCRIYCGPHHPEMTLTLVVEP